MEGVIKCKSYLLEKVNTVILSSPFYKVSDLNTTTCQEPCDKAMGRQ